MTKLNQPFQIDPFWEAYKETLGALRDVGKKFPLKKRLSIFKLYNDISAMPETEDTQLALWKLTELRDLIARGLEPEHKNGVYK